MDLLPEGTYRAHAGERLLGKTTKGFEQVAVECIVDQPGFEGQSITYYGFFSEAAFQYAVNSLRAMGWEGDDLADLSTVGKKPFSIVVKHEEYEGKLRAKVQFVNGDGVAMKNVMGTDEVKKFAASMRSKIAALSPTVRATPKAVAPTQNTTSDIPF